MVSSPPELFLWGDTTKQYQLENQLITLRFAMAAGRSEGEANPKETINAPQEKQI